MDYAGQRVGRLTVIKKTERSGKGRTYWLCVCDCGNQVEVRGDSFKKGGTRSCGCLKKEIARIKAIDLSGMKFGHLTVFARAEGKRDGRQWWACKCDCGKIIEVSGGPLMRGKTDSCGCQKPVFVKEIGDDKHMALRKNTWTNVKNMVGYVVGRLTVISRSERKSKNGQAYWICKCECGNETDVSGSHLRSGHTSSCGCLNDENRKRPRNQKKGVKAIDSIV